MRPSLLRPLVLLFVASIAGSATAAPQDLLYELYPNDPAPYDDFGRSIATDGTRIIVGAVGDDDNGSVSGSAYLFDLATGQQLHKLLASDGAAIDNFGGSVDIEGGLCIVGAWAHDALGWESGAAYVYDTATGQELWKLQPGDGAAGDNFGKSVALSGTLAIVGSWKHDHAGMTDAGAAYVFDLTTGQQIHKVTPGSLDADDQFGNSVGMDGDLAVVGSYYRDGVGVGSGRAYVVDVPSGTVIGVLVPGDVAAGDFHGYSVAVHGDRALVSSPYDDDGADSTGSVYLYDLSNGFLLDKFVASDATSWDLFGFSVALHGDTAVIGTPFDTPFGQASGSAYWFDLDSGQERGKIVPADGEADERFGYSVAVHGTTLLSSAYHDDDNGTYSGSVYVYDGCPDSLTLVASPDIAFAGDPLHFATYGGRTGGLCALFVTAVNGSPFWFRVTTGFFDQQCRHLLSTTTPGGLAGLDITFQSLGFTPTGLQASNLDVVQFR